MLFKINNQIYNHLTDNQYTNIIIINKTVISYQN
jgi:hypothetical protein